MRVLFLTHRLPYAPNRGDRTRAYHMLRTLAEHVEVDVGSLVHSDEEAGHAGDLHGIATEVVVGKASMMRNRVRGVCALLGTTPLTHILLDAPRFHDELRRLVERRRPDIVLAFCSGMARFAMVPPLSSIPFLLDLVDVDSAKWEALSETARPPMNWVYKREARCLQRFEVDAIARARATYVVNERERKLVQALGCDATVLSNGLDLARLGPTGPPCADPVVVFTGVFSYQPNADAAVWLAQSVWPMVRGALPAARLVLAGAEPGRAVRRLAVDDASVSVTGAVPDIRPHLWNAAVAAAPLRVARGVQNKVLEAIAAGLPTVVTAAVAEGLPGEVLPACEVADTPEVFATKLLALLRLTPDERRNRAGSARLDLLAWSRTLKALLDAVVNGDRELNIHRPPPGTRTRRIPGG